MKNNILVSAGVALVVVVLGLVFFGQPATNTAIEKVREVIGAVPGPDISSPYLSVNGVVRHYTSASLITATTTPCVLRGPGATSSLISFTLVTTNSTSTGKQVIFAVGNAAMQASTTRLTSYFVAAGAQAALKATTTTESIATTTSNSIVNPDGYVNVSFVGGGGTDSYTGTCSAIFEEL